ncbi:MAG: hypothetical protein AAF389_06690 [Gemmatimonadota bacterium]
MMSRSTSWLVIVGTMCTVSACADAPEPPIAFGDLAFDTLFTIGSDGGAAHESFEGVWDIDVDAEGRLAVLDIGAPAVHLYDVEGTYLGSIDSEGLEEGQIDAPSGIVWSSPGQLLIWDPGSSWISRFRADANGFDFVERWRAFAFGETGFCGRGDRAYLSYYLNDFVVHEVGPDGIEGSFGAAPTIAGADNLDGELLDIAVEELTPSALLCTPSGIVDVSFMQSTLRLHDEDGTEVWARTIDGVRPITAYSDDFGLGRAFDVDDGSHLLRALAGWGRSHVLVQHEVRRQEYPEPGEPEVFESRIVSLTDGSEVDRTRDLPLLLAAGAGRLFFVRQTPFPTVTVVALQ